ncbi:uncharacterized protein LOC108425016 [Pygocentrus nattereri]|uniref:uncharacterized protein LOC108425016 n=1 Tax=Pygocentrus nattereri TaxID=42514 RepID=UPI00189194D2|nr:uncharacterized protein LOC108425016 [Pygocentrus nattereri]
MKCFERLVIRWIKDQLLPGPTAFCLSSQPSIDYAISTTLHLAITHLDNKDTYIRMLFMDFSLACNTIILQHLIGKLSLLGLNTSLCNWVLDFLTKKPQLVRISINISGTTILSTGAPQCCVLSPLLAHDFTAKYSSNHIIKFTDDTTVVGLISKNDGSAYRGVVQCVTDSCRTNNLSLNVGKTKEIVVDTEEYELAIPLNINGSARVIVRSTKFLCVHITENRTWSLNTNSTAKRAHQHLYVLRRLKKAHLFLPSSPCAPGGLCRAS